TAEDNVQLYGAIMEMSKKEMEDKFEEIFEFAELPRFRNMKLKNFSSGMYARHANEAAVVPLAMITRG
ncbi:MAG: polysaccharide ABC transporter ATP-binding protein, partial [Candidatus Methanoperedens nitroreducens]